MKQSIALTELMRCLDEFAPFALASGWDNSGLQIGDFSVPITGILLCVDCTEAVVQEAVEKRCELILSHHPLLFRPFKQIVEQFGSQRVVRQLIRHNIALISTHTNLDYAEKGLCFAMAKTLGLAEIQPVIGPGEEDAGYGRWGCIETMPLRALAHRAKEAFSATTVKYAGAPGMRPGAHRADRLRQRAQGSAASCFAAGGGCGGYVGCGVQRCAGRRGGRPVRGGCRPL